MPWGSAHSQRPRGAELGHSANSSLEVWHEGDLSAPAVAPRTSAKLQMASGVYLTFFASFVFGKPGFPLSDVPVQAIVADVEAGRYQAKPARVFRFEDIREAHRVMESNEARGKWSWFSEQRLR